MIPKYLSEVAVCFDKQGERFMDLRRIHFGEACHALDQASLGAKDGFGKRSLLGFQFTSRHGSIYRTTGIAKIDRLIGQGMLWAGKSLALLAEKGASSRKKI